MYALFTFIYMISHQVSEKADLSDIELEVSITWFSWPLLFYVCVVKIYVCFYETDFPKGFMLKPLKQKR